MHHGTKSGLSRLRRPVAMLGAASVALVVGGTALLVPTVTVANVPSGCVKRCDRSYARALAFCARAGTLTGETPTTDGEVNACAQLAVEAHDDCLAACGVVVDPY